MRKSILKRKLLLKMTRHGLFFFFDQHLYICAVVIEQLNNIMLVASCEIPVNVVTTLDDRLANSDRRKMTINNHIYQLMEFH